MRITFVIPARNEEAFLGRCLESIQTQNRHSQSTVKISVIVVDNSSEDKTVEVAKSYGVQVVPNPPSNAATTRNVGAKNHNSDFIAFVDADCVLPNHWLECCLGHLADENVVAVGSSQAYSGRPAPWIERVWTDVISHHDARSWEKKDWLPAFNLIIRAKHFDQAGGFDESLETCEDSDLTFKLSKFGELRLDHTIPTLHLGESQTITEFMQREMWRSRGNFASALKRDQIQHEFKSLFIPIAYVAVLSILLVSPIVFFTSFRIGMPLTVISMSMALGLPLAIARKKGRRESLLSRSAAMMIYLVARGIGPFVKTPRVKRPS